MANYVDKVKIRRGTYEDLSDIFGLVKALALFEKEPESVTTDLATYQSCFSEGLIHSFVATIDEKVVGMTLFYMAFSTWRGRMLYLDDFVVHDEYRSLGIGQMLFDATVQEAKDKGCTMMKWQVLDWNTEASRFYERNNAIVEKNWWNVKLIF